MEIACGCGLYVCTYSFMHKLLQSTNRSYQLYSKPWVCVWYYLWFVPLTWTFCCIDNFLTTTTCSLFLAYHLIWIIYLCNTYHRGHILVLWIDNFIQHHDYKRQHLCISISNISVNANVKAWYILCGTFCAAHVSMISHYLSLYLVGTGIQDIPVLWSGQNARHQFLSNSIFICTKSRSISLSQYLCIFMMNLLSKPFRITR